MIMEINSTNNKTKVDQQTAKLLKITFIVLIFFICWTFFNPKAFNALKHLVHSFKQFKFFLFYHEMLLHGQIFYNMKQFRVVSLSSKNQFIVQDSNGNYFQYPIQGFSVPSQIAVRHHFDNFIGQNIDCTLNKTSTHIRYQNQVFLTQKLAIGAMSIVTKELEESKIYSNDVKSRFAKVQKKQIQSNLKIVDLVNNSKELLKYFPKAQSITSRIEYLSEEIVVSINRENQLIYVPLRLRNINILFEYLPENTTAQFLAKHPKLTIQLQRPNYNLIHKRFQLLGHIEPEIELQILNQGWGVINSSSISHISATSKVQKYIESESIAKEKHIGAFSRSTEILAFFYAKNNFVGEVSDVFDGYIFEVIRQPSCEKVKIQLAMVRSPIGDQVGAFNARQFARKNLIGQKVNVYLHKDTGLNITGSLIRTKDLKDVQTLMVEQGWAFTREEFTHSILSLKLIELEKKARQKAVGLHNKQIGVHRPQDLTVPNTQKEQIYVYRRIEVLKQLTQNEVGVLDGAIDTTNYRIWLQNKNIILKIKLFGVNGHNINPLLEDVKKLKQEWKDLYQKKLKKRSITVTILQYNKEINAFIGTITFQGGKTLQEILLQEAFVYSDKENATPQEYKQIQKKVKLLGKGIWGPNLIKFEPINPLDIQAPLFNGKFSWIQDGQTVFIQPQSNYKTLGLILNQLESTDMKRASKDQIVIGSLLAAPYEGDLYRVLVTFVKNKKVKVFFVDWGNRETIEQGQFWQLPEDLKFIEKQCLKAKLFLTKPMHSSEHLDRLRSELIDGNQYQFKKQSDQYVFSYRNKENINLSLIEKGYIKSNTTMADPNIKKKIIAMEALLHKNKIGVWEWSDDEEENDQNEDD